MLDNITWYAVYNYPFHPKPPPSQNPTLYCFFLTYHYVIVNTITSPTPLPPPLNTLILIVPKCLYLSLSSESFPSTANVKRGLHSLAMSKSNKKTRNRFYFFSCWNIWISLHLEKKVTPSIEITFYVIYYYLIFIVL